MAVTLKSCFAALPKTVQGQPIVLGGDPNGKNFLYCNGNNVYIRDIDNPAIVDIYAQHENEATVAKYSPNGFYIASGDTAGKVRVWDTVNKEHILKNEFKPLGGAVKDIDWSPNSKTLVIGGDGWGKFATCIAYDSDISVGDIIGHSRAVNSCSYKPTRPFRIVTASEDQSVVFLEGPPFKYVKSITAHFNSVNCVRYSPTGDNFISGGAGGRAYIYDGKAGDQIGELGSPAHKNGVYSLSYSPDGTQVLTVSGDKTAKLWDVSTLQVVTEFPLGKDITDMQVGSLWQGQHMLSVSLSGYINYLDKNNPSRPIRIIKGHTNPITALAVSLDRDRVFTGSSDASIKIKSSGQLQSFGQSLTMRQYWNTTSGECEEVKGKGHSNQVQGMVMVGDTLATIGLDDTFRLTSTVSNEYGVDSTRLSSQPNGLCRRNDISVVACKDNVTVMQGDRKLASIIVKYAPLCVDMHPQMTHVTVGGTNKLVIYELSSGALSEKKSFDLPNCHVGAVRYSPDGAFLVAVGSDRVVRGYKTDSVYKEAFSTPGHNAQILDVSWSPDSTHFATCSLDSSIYVWIPVDSTSNKIAAAEGTHGPSHPNKIKWLDNNTLVSVGEDSCVKQWNVRF